ncbi:MAG TPA: carboxylase [Bacteroidales bacterium]|jgi:oxaloacetate decarboxylase alpha subunit/pyruvate carboxylase subunit B|nr:carboxylase [Bacteroidales bacterium]HNZ42816.1 carboxylase [Bacteroidales bacterium]HOH83111.1 carboxylase [Bacteroidales bacterium]HPB24997.1 carboxylase [Bacteroidales bacterium]HPI30249.1 carboxylase [Bacteroidales bacterium]
MKRKLLIRDLTLRDGQQSLFATRMNQEQVDKVIPLYKEANFYAMEVWGGAVPDSIMRYLGENPWDRLEKIKVAIGDSCKLTALSRGRNLFGYNPYPEEVIEGFCRYAIQSGIGIMRIFDALNDVDNIKSSIKYVKENGGIADATVCYTVDPHFSSKDRIKALLRAKLLPNNIFTDEYFLNKALEMEALGADMISVKDMAGLIPPVRSGRLIKLLKEKLKIPVDFHTHCTPGYGLASSLMAVINGVDILDTSIMTFAGGPAAPAYELIQLFCNKLGVETGVNQEVVVKINNILRDIRTEMADVDSYKMFPREFDITRDKLPQDIDDLFELAIAYAKSNKEEELLDCCHKIERYFKFPEPNENVKFAEIPGGMYTNMLAQLKTLKLEKLLPRTLEIIPTVRLAAGCPPLVTPTSQIVGVQAVNCIIDENKGQPFYTTKSIQFVNLVKGQYGHTPIPIDPEFRYKIAGVKEETPYDTKNYRKQDNPVFPEYGDVKLADNPKDELLLELFPAVATDFLKNRVINKYLAEIHRIEEEKLQKHLKEKQAYEDLSPEEKEKRLMEGLNKF